MEHLARLLVRRPTWQPHPYLWLRSTRPGLRSLQHLASAALLLASHRSLNSVLWSCRIE